MKLIACLSIFLALLFTLGCDGSSSSTDSTLRELDEFQREQDQKLLDQIESEGVAIIDQDYTLGMADKLDAVADELDEADAAVVRDQAMILREMQKLIDPYLTALNAFLSLGGLDVNTLGDVAGFQTRLDLIDELIEQNEVIAEKYPPLLRQMGGDPALLAQSLGITNRIREIDREMFPRMKSYLIILRDNWD